MKSNLTRLYRSPSDRLRAKKDTVENTKDTEMNDRQGLVAYGEFCLVFLAEDTQHCKGELNSPVIPDQLKNVKSIITPETE